MNFTEGKPIYLQIVELFYENILSDTWRESERIPSVREAAMMVEVNPNTMMRTFNKMQEEEVIFNKRGIGYFVSEDGKQRVLDIKQKEFMEVVLPDVFKKMELLNITFEELERNYKKTIKLSHNEKK